MVYEKKQLSKKILAIAASIAIAVAFMPMFGNFAYAASDEDTYNVTSPENGKVEVEYTGQEPDLSQVEALAQITVANVADPTKTATLTRGVDYTVAAVDAGPGLVNATFTTMGAYADKAINPIKINIKEASAPDEYTATLDASGLVYIGELDGLDDVKEYIWWVLAEEEGLIVLKNGTQKVYDYDLDITPDASVTNPKGFAGEKYNIKVKVSGQEAPVYEGTVEIQKFDLSKAFEVATGATVTYNGAAQTPDLGALAVTAGEEGNTYSVGEIAAADYTVKGYADNTNAGTAKATIEAKASAVNFTGAATVEFPIAQAEIGNKTVIKLNGNGQELAYTGKEQKPAVDITVYVEEKIGAAVIPASDYDIVYLGGAEDAAGDCTNVGDKFITIAPKENGNLVVAAGEEVPPVKAYTIKSADMANVVITQIVDEIVAGTVIDASNFAQYFTAMLGEVKVVAGTDFDIAYTSGKDSHAAGATDELTLTGKGNYDKTATKEVKLGSKAFAEKYTSAASFDYDGTAKVPNAAKLGTLTAKGGTETITTDDYEVTGTYKNNTNAGTATATIQGKGDYAGRTAVVEFTIAPKNVADYTATVTGIKEGTYYAGAVIEGATVKLTKAATDDSEPADEITLAAADAVVTAKTFAAEENKLTEVTVTLNEGANYAGGPFTAVLDPAVIAKVADLSKATITGTIPAGLTTIDAAVIQKYVTVTVDGTVVTPDSYAVSNIVAANTNVGNNVTFAIAPAAGVSQLTGNKSDCSVAIAARDINDLKDAFAVADGNVYTGKALTPAVSYTTQTNVKDLVLDTDYTVAYSKNVDAGKAIATITGKGNYTGSVEKEFVIGQATVTAADVVIDGVKAADMAYHAGDITALTGLTLKAADGKDFAFAASDYELALVAGQKDVAAGTDVSYTVTINKDNKETGNYKSSTFTKAAYTVTPKQLAAGEATITLKNAEIACTGAAITDVTPLGLEVKVGDAVLKAADYTATIKGETSKITADLTPEEKAPYVEVEFRGNYAGLDKVNFTVVAAEADKDFASLVFVEPKASELVYGSFEGLRVSYTGKYADQPWEEDGDFTVKYTDKATGKEVEGIPSDAGTYVAAIVSAEKYGSVVYATKEFTITPKNLTKAEFERMTKMIVAGSYDYDEDFMPYVAYLGEKTPAPVLKDGGFMEVADQFEAVEWDKTWDGNEATKGKATIALKKDANYAYDGTATVEFEWTAGEIYGYEGYGDDVNNYFEITGAVYNGTELEPAVQVKEGCEFSADWVTVKYYENNVNAAEKTAKAYVEVKSPATEKRYDVNLKGFIVFTIAPAQIADQTITVAKATYAGKAVTPKVTIKDADGALLTLDKDYKVAYKNNTKAGKGTVTVTGIKNYTGTKDVQFTINKGVQKITKVTPASKTYKANKKTKKLAKAYTFTLKATATPAKGGGKVTFKKANKVGGAKVVVAKTGKVTVKKGLKKGTYKVKVKATKAANANYKVATKTVTVKIIVR